MRYPYDNFPQDFTLTAGNAYGQKVSYGYHSGIDVNGKRGGNTDCGIPIFALSDGTCTSVERSQTGYGNHLHIKIEGEWGTRWSHHCHLQTIFISEGQEVKEGQKIATIGSSGNSTACHDHWEIKRKPVGINAVAKTIASLTDGWENPLEFVANNITSSPGNQSVIDELRRERDRNWNLYQEVLSELQGIKEEKKQFEDFRRQLARKLNVEDQPTAILGSVEKIIGIEDRYTLLSVKFDKLEKELKTLDEKDAYIRKLESDLGNLAGAEELRKECEERYSALKKKKSLADYSRTELLVAFIKSFT